MTRNNVLIEPKKPSVECDHKIDKIKDSGRDNFKATYIEDNIWIIRSSLVVS